jgi:hypothetical protein
MAKHAGHGAHLLGVTVTSPDKKRLDQILASENRLPDQRANGWGNTIASHPADKVRTEGLGSHGNNLSEATMPVNIVDESGVMP